MPLFTLIREGKLAANWPLEQDEFKGGNSHLINTHEGFDPTPVCMLAYHVTLDELPEASARIRKMKDIK